MTRTEIEMMGKNGATGSNEAKVLDDFYLFVNREEESLGRWLAYEGMWEAWITSFFTKIIKPGDVICDLGANYGYYTRLFQRLAGESGKVYCIEANPDLTKLIEKSISQYPMESGAEVVVLNVAAMDVRGSVVLNIPTSLGGASIVGKPEGSYPVVVEAWPLDDLILDKVDIIKIDIEGAEPFAMAGMKNIMKSVRCCVIEIGNYHPEVFLNEIFETYSVSRVDFNGNEEYFSYEMLKLEQDFVMVVLRNRNFNLRLNSIPRRLKNRIAKFIYKVLIKIANSFAQP